MNIFKFFSFFKDALFVDVSINESIFIIPQELKKDNDLFMRSYVVIIDNYSNKTIEKVSIKYKFDNKYKPMARDEEDKIIDFTEEQNLLVFRDLYPKHKLYINLYPDMKNKNNEIKPIIYIEGKLLDWKSNIINSLYNFFKFKTFAFIIIAFFSYLFYSMYSLKQTLYIQTENTNERILKKELIEQKIFNYYERIGLKPSLGKFDIKNVPSSFYEQEELKKYIKKNCDEKYIFEVNNVFSYKDLFEQKQIMVCE